VVRVDPPQRKAAEEIDPQIAGAGMPDQLHGADVGPERETDIMSIRTNTSRLWVGVGISLRRRDC
jgi:hypothetical protein